MRMKFVNGGSYTITDVSADERVMLRSALESYAAMLKASAERAASVHPGIADGYIETANAANKLARALSPLIP